MSFYDFRRAGQQLYWLQAAQGGDIEQAEGASWATCQMGDLPQVGDPQSSLFEGESEGTPPLV